MDNVMKRQQVETLLARARAGERPTGVICALPNAQVIEIISRFDYAYLILDQEHTLIDSLPLLADLIAVADNARLPTIIKINEPDPIMVRDVTDAGACGVMHPFTSSATQLREFIDACRFPPLGTRGFCSLARAVDYSVFGYAGRQNIVQSFIDFINESLIIIPTIESVEGVNNLDEILAIPDCHIFHVGFEDLWMSVRHDGHDQDYALRLTKTVCRRIHEAGKLVMLNVEHKENRDDMVAAIDAFHNAMPFMIDTWALGYGLEQGLKAVAASGKQSFPSAAEPVNPTRVATGRNR